MFFALFSDAMKMLEIIQPPSSLTPSLRLYFVFTLFLVLVSLTIYHINCRVYPKIFELFLCLGHQGKTGRVMTHEEGEEVEEGTNIHKNQGNAMDLNQKGANSFYLALLSSRCIHKYFKILQSRYFYFLYLMLYTEGSVNIRKLYDKMGHYTMGRGYAGRGGAVKKDLQ